MTGFARGPHATVEIVGVGLSSAKQIGNFEKLRKIAAVNIVKVQNQMRAITTAECRISVQGQDAGGACKGVMFLVQNLKCPVEVSFLWRNKEGAEKSWKTGNDAVVIIRDAVSRVFPSSPCE